MTNLNRNDKVLITGGTGLIGTNLKNRLSLAGYAVLAIGSKDGDLRDFAAAKELFTRFNPNVVFHLAARVGGIYANSNFKSDYYSDNVLINTNVVNLCVQHGVSYVFAMGTGCAYPKRLEGQVLHEADFLDGIPEVTNDAYAYAKRGLLVHLAALHKENALNYTYCLPANIYGMHDNFHPMHSHVVPGLIRRFSDACHKKIESVPIWGNGRAARDFLHIDDCVDAILQLAEEGYTGSVNVASGELTSIKSLAETIKAALGFSGAITFDESFPEGQLARIFDTSLMQRRNWNPRISLPDGIQRTVEWFRSNREQIRER